MWLPIFKLSPLQSRFAVSLAGTIFLILVYLSLHTPSFAYALEDTSFTEEDATIRTAGKEQHLNRRAPEGSYALSNNAPQNLNIDFGVTQTWLFTQETFEGDHGTPGLGLPGDSSNSNLTNRFTTAHRELLKRQSGGTPIWISINTCLQPSSNTSDQNAIPPQLQMYWSDSIQKPGPLTGAEQVEVVGGYAMVQLNATSDIYIGVFAPNNTEGSFTESWNYEIAASNDAPYHSWSNETSLLFVDGDNHAALLVTTDLTNASSNTTLYKDWLSLSPPPYGIFAQSQVNKSILGLSRSYCGLLQNTKITANLKDIENNNVAGMTSRGLGSAPKEQFYISSLDASTQYWGFLAMQRNSTPGIIGGGGKVWSAMNFSTKASDNCALMYNLSFCSEVAYAVPSNPEKYSPSTGLPDLAAVYDSYAAQMYQYFNYSLQQIPCNTTSSAQYSLARNCDDCARAYKQWLCAVTIPRCEDWSNEAPYLAPRNMMQNFVNGSTPPWIGEPDGAQAALLSSVASNSSRNAQIIDDVIQPGPYKEVLPCIDLCYDLVQSCPAALGFGCPQFRWQNTSYGMRSSDPGVLSCSYLGAAYYLSEGSNGLWGAQRVMRAASVALGVVLGILVF
ncbi:hypothetical protein H2198_000797 [Neophaeococcomyces mojaviensis]|uniref:Uncharacterized protein n=1 Tax=Neophaeococcomyces mojaviensis TaxID=3383035 RepID=A0ACC3AIZ0_9EURO|nr:hypothetical protein H2198_000797 [Knufia sp. JES_112]